MKADRVFAKIKKLGAAGTVKMAAVKWKKAERDLHFPTALSRKENIERILAKGYQRVIIFENHFGYRNIMMQRPQHLLRNMGDEDTVVFYNSYYDIDFEKKGRITKVAPSVFVIDLYYYRDYLLELCEKLREKYVMVYSTDTMPVRRLRQYITLGFHMIYEYVDDINPDLISPSRIRAIEERHRFLLERNDALVVTTADKLYRNVAETGPKARTVLISNGAECEKFRPESKTQDEEYLSWLKPEKIHVGYYGALASWVDYDLLKYLAEEEDVQIVLIGIEHDGSLRESGLLCRENVRYFGKKPYEQLAGYVHYLDVCMIPFVVNDITKATSPVKLFEYMSMEKQIVTTALPECMKYDVVNVAHSKEEFVRMVRDCRTNRDDLNIRAQLRECAQENDWKAKAAVLKGYLNERERDER